MATTFGQKVIEEFNLSDVEGDRMTSVVQYFMDTMNKSHKRIENKCMARIWGKSGSGNEQCKCKQVDGEYCKKHYKQAVVSEEPCIRDENGVKVGLFFGRIDRFQEDLYGIPPYKDRNNRIQIIWKNDDVATHIETDIENGCKHFKKQKNKQKSPSVVEDSITCIEEEIEVEKIEWNEFTWYWDRKTDNLYEDGSDEIIGTWDNNRRVPNLKNE